VPSSKHFRTGSDSPGTVPSRLRTVVSVLLQSQDRFMNAPFIIRYIVVPLLFVTLWYICYICVMSWYNCYVFVMSWYTCYVFVTPWYLYCVLRCRTVIHCYLDDNITLWYFCMDHRHHAVLIYITNICHWYAHLSVNCHVSDAFLLFVTSYKSQRTQNSR
jgi:prepilin signal peptidase PulO-like enzyme (type II secretory pathway)